MDLDEALTGSWSGHYEQWDCPLGSDPSGRHPIRATFSVTDGVLTGEMEDLEPVCEEVYLAYLKRIGHPALDRWKFAFMLALLRSTKAKIKLELPASSNLKGKVEGNRVSFTKQYRGASVTSMSVGASNGNRGEEDVVIHYSGELSEDGEQIRGEYRAYLDQNAEPPSGLFNSGVFDLSKT